MQTLLKPVPKVFFGHFSIIKNTQPFKRKNICKTSVVFKLIMILILIHFVSLHIMIIIMHLYTSFSLFYFFPFLHISFQFINLNLFIHLFIQLVVHSYMFCLFINIYSLSRHLRRVHERDMKYNCDKCDFKSGHKVI